MCPCNTHPHKEKHPIKPTFKDAKKQINRQRGVLQAPRDPRGPRVSLGDAYVYKIDDAAAGTVKERSPQDYVIFGAAAGRPPWVTDATMVLNKNLINIWGRMILCPAPPDQRKVQTRGPLKPHLGPQIVNFLCHRAPGPYGPLGPHGPQGRNAKARRPRGPWALGPGGK